MVLSKKTAFTSDNGATAGPLPAVGDRPGPPGRRRQEGGGPDPGPGSIVVDGKYVTGSGGAPNLVFSYVDEPFSNSAFIAAAGPPTDGTVAVNQKLADDEHLKVGQQVGVATDKGVVPGHGLGHLQARRRLLDRRRHPGRAHVQGRPAVV